MHVSQLSRGVPTTQESKNKFKESKYKEVAPSKAGWWAPPAPYSTRCVRFKRWVSWPPAR